ncbi:MAG: Ig-like domain-containing protein [Bacteroidota bacterium]
MRKIYFFLLALFALSFAKAQNTAPVAVNDTITIYHKGEMHTVNVISNDVDAEGDSIYIYRLCLLLVSNTIILQFLSNPIADTKQKQEI